MGRRGPLVSDRTVDPARGRRRRSHHAAISLAVAGCLLVAGCAALPRSAAATTVRPAARPNGNLAAFAFPTPSAGYGAFEEMNPNGRECRYAIGRTDDGGADFGPLVPVTSWSCASAFPRATSLVADGRGDGFFYDPALFVTHDAGKRWSADPQPGTVLAVAVFGESVWMLEADCAREQSQSSESCPLQLLESNDGGVSWVPSPTQPPGASARGTGGAVIEEGALGQSWLVRLGRSSAYVLSRPVGRANFSPDGTPVWFTDDGGASWTRRQVPCGLDGWSVVLSAAPDGTLFSVCAGEPGGGYQAKSTSVSTDGGMTWAVHPTCDAQTQNCTGLRVPEIDFGYLGTLDAVSDTTAFLIGSRGDLLTTQDGGVDWELTPSAIGDPDGGPSQVDFATVTDGLVLAGGALWRTTDDGSQWSKVVPRTR
jgi:photosystem II stability/assembly factor-like uncharacterized protein